MPRSPRVREPDGHTRLPVRVSEQERAELEAAAEAAGVPLSTYVREVALAAAAARPLDDDAEPEGASDSAKAE